VAVAASCKILQAWINEGAYQLIAVFSEVVLLPQQKPNEVRKTSKSKPQKNKTRQI